MTVTLVFIIAVVIICIGNNDFNTKANKQHLAERQQLLDSAQKERQQLLDRIQSSSFPEYKALTVVKTPQIKNEEAEELEQI